MSTATDRPAWGWLSDADLGEICRFGGMNVPRVRLLLRFLVDVSAFKPLPERGPLALYTGRVLPADGVSLEEIEADLAPRESEQR